MFILFLCDVAEGETPCQISADVIGAVTLQTKVLGCLFSTRWQGNIFVHSIMPKVQETQGADGEEKGGGAGGGGNAWH